MSGRTNHSRRIISMATLVLMVFLFLLPGLPAAAASPTLVIQASTTTTVGQPIFAGANLGGGDNPTGAITFNVYAPGDLVCASSQDTSVVPVNGNGSYQSPPFNTTQAGTYQWTALYSGDANNTGAPTACNDPAGAVVVNEANTAVSGFASPSVQVGGIVTNTATLLSGFNATGTITFNLYGPSDEFCSAATVFSDTKSVTGNGDYTSSAYMTLTPGVHRWTVEYSGDGNNTAAGPTACSDPQNDVLVTAPGPVTPTLTTTASAGVTVGGQVTDSAALAGGNNPTGQITFTLYGPDDGGCTVVAFGPSSVTVAGNGTYMSAPFTTTVPGTFRWKADYSGDANNDSVSNACNDPSESVVVTPTVVPTIQVVKTATPLTRPAPGGSFTFNLAVTNTSSEVLTITSLTDDLYGDVTTRANSSCTTAIGSVLQPSPGPGNTYLCSFSADFNGNAGDSQTDVVTVRATNSVGVEVTDNDDAIIALTPGTTPTIQVVKIASPESKAAPGGEFTFNLQVSNSGPVAFTITSIVDNVYGNLATRPDPNTCDDLINDALAPAASVSCSFTGSFTGNAGFSQTDVVTVVGTATDGQTATDTDDATVTITQVTPVLSTQASGTVAVGGSLSDTATLSGGVNPTGTITFELYGPGDPDCTKPVTFTSAKTVTGNGTYTSDSYTTGASGIFRWRASYGGDVNNAPVTAPCNAPNELVNVTPPTSTAAELVIVEATAGALSAPGGDFLVTVRVINAGGKQFRIDSLNDSTYGNLANQPGDCDDIINDVLQPGQSASCTVTLTFTGVPGAVQASTVTVVAIGSVLIDTAELVLRITGGLDPFQALFGGVFGPLNAQNGALNPFNLGLLPRRTGANTPPIVVTNNNSSSSSSSAAAAAGGGATVQASAGAVMAASPAQAAAAAGQTSGRGVLARTGGEYLAALALAMALIVLGFVLKRPRAFPGG